MRKKISYPNRETLRKMYKERKIRAIGFQDFKALIFADIDIKNGKFEKDKESTEVIKFIETVDTNE